MTQAYLVIAFYSGMVGKMKLFFFLQHLLSSKINSLMFSVIILVIIREELQEGEAGAVGPGAREVGRDRVLKMLFETLDLAMTGVNDF